MGWRIRRQLFCGARGFLFARFAISSCSGRTLGVDRYQASFRQHQIGHDKQRQQLSRVLCQTAITGFAVLEQVLHYVKRALDLGTYACLGMLDVVEGATI
jgi:hypothetical protein